MFERYTEHARRVIFHARHAASQSGSPMIETEHLLLGLLSEAGPLIPRLAPGVSIEDVYRKIPRRPLIRKRIAAPLTMPLSVECKRILGRSAEEATRLNHSSIGAEHLLLAILHEDKSMAARILEEAGIQLEPLRERVTADIAQRQGAEPTEWLPVDVCRETVHALVDELPEKMLGYAKIAIDHMLAASHPGRLQREVERAATKGPIASIRHESGKGAAKAHHAGDKSKFL